MSDTTAEPVTPDAPATDEPDTTPDRHRDDTRAGEPDGAPADDAGDGAPAGGDDDDDTPVVPEPDDGQGGAAAPGPPDGDDGMTEKQMKAALEKLDNEATRHANRVSEIMGEDAQTLVPCELCVPNIPGFRFPVEPPDDVKARVRIAIGLPDMSNFAKAENARECDGCRGLGKVLTGSQVPLHMVVDCKRCGGRGYLTVGGDVPVPEPLTPGSVTDGIPLDEGAELEEYDMWGTHISDPDFGVMPNLRSARAQARAAGIGA